MDNIQLVERIKKVYGEEDIPYSDTELMEYLLMADDEIISWEYRLVGIPEDRPDTSKYDTIKVFAVIGGLTIHGAEGQTVMNEGNFSRSFKYADMVDYIHAHITPFVGVGR